jgi:hypothetical protein
VEHDLTFADGLRGVLTLEDEPRLGVVALHGSSAPSRDDLLLRHLSAVYSREGVAVLRFDRRSMHEGDVPLRIQAEDALAAVTALRSAVRRELDIVAWGYSQGAWAALLLAQLVTLEGVVLVGGAGVSPAEQMRYASERGMRDAGYATETVQVMRETRAKWERALCGEDIQGAQRALDWASGESWFDLAWLPTVAEELDPKGFEYFFDPAPLLQVLAAPALIVVGDDDRWVPLSASTPVLASAPRAEMLLVPGGGHAPTTNGESDGRILPAYEDGLCDWLRGRIASAGTS